MITKGNFLFLLFIATKCFSECTSFCFSSNDTILFGNNLDWYTGNGIVIINKRNVFKKGCWFNNKPIWTSKYGSITINQFGREFPSRGMNEAGLVVGEMTLSETRFPDPDSRHPISLLQWIQYQLDNCATIGEVIKTDLKIRIDQSEYHSHFLVADSSGNCVTMEWLNGKLVYHTHDSLPVKVLTNSTYSSCIEYYNNNSNPSLTNFSSEARFYRAAEMIKNYGSNSTIPGVEYAFNILRSVGPGSWTKWSLVFDITNRRFYFRTNLNNNIRYVDFSSFNFTCDNPVKIFQLDNQYSGDVQDYFIDYDFEINRATLVHTFDLVGSYIGSPSEWVKETMANYPETTVCIPILSIQPDNQIIPEYRIFQNYPNPFNPSTTIKYHLKKPNNVILKIYNPTGQHLETLVNEHQTAGEYKITWQPKGLPSGIYLYRLQVEDPSTSSPQLRSGQAGQRFTVTKKLILQK